MHHNELPKIKTTASIKLIFMQPVQPMLATSHCVPKSISMDTENYFQLIRGTNASKEKQPRTTKGEDKKGENSTS